MASDAKGNGNLQVSSSIEDSQVFYRLLGEAADNKINREKEFFSKDYQFLGRTPLRKQLAKGNYLFIVKKYRALPIVERVTVTGKPQDLYFEQLAGFQFVNKGRFKHNGVERQLNSFFMAEAELTNEVYFAYCSQTGYPLPYYHEDDRFNRPEQPVIGITYADAVAYTQWLSDKTGLTCRLPYEFEWEYVASKGDEKRIFPWGNYDRKVGSYMANYHPFDFKNQKLEPIDIDGFRYPAPVRSFPATENKFYDLGGNVFEWCLDTIRSAAAYADYNLKKTPLAEARIVKGGSWNFNQLLMQIKAHVFVDGRIAEGNNGIRILIEME